MIRLFLLMMATNDIDKSDVHRFPFDYAECSRRHGVATQHVQALEVGGARLYARAWLEDAEWRQKVWLYLVQAKSNSGVWYLSLLRDEIGVKDFELGRMPDYLPTYRFFDVGK